MDTPCPFAPAMVYTRDWMLSVFLPGSCWLPLCSEACEVGTLFQSLWLCCAALFLAGRERILVAACAYLWRVCRVRASKTCLQVGRAPGSLQPNLVGMQRRREGDGDWPPYSRCRRTCCQRAQTLVRSSEIATDPKLPRPSAFPTEITPRQQYARELISNRIAKHNLARPI